MKGSFTPLEKFTEGTESWLLDLESRVYGVEAPTIPDSAS